MNDDIEAIEITIPKLESFYTSYDVITKAVTANREKLKEFNTSTTSSDGITDKRAGLKVMTYAYEYVQCVHAYLTVYAIAYVPHTFSRVHIHMYLDFLILRLFMRKWSSRGQSSISSSSHVTSMTLHLSRLSLRVMSLP